MRVADQIRSRMEQLGVGVPELARRMKCSPQTVRYWTSGRNLPIDILPRLKAGEDVNGRCATDE